MTLHKNLVFGVINILNNIFNDNFFADKAIEKGLMSYKKRGSKDRGFIAETCYEIVRWIRVYTEIANVIHPFDSKKFWKIFAVWAVLRGIALPEWKELENTPKRKIKGKFDELSKIRRFRESIPDWLDALGSNELGESIWEKELSELNKIAPLVIRSNTLKVTVHELQSILKDEGVESKKINGYPNALLIKKRCNLFQKESFKRGFFELQDASSQLVAHFLEVNPTMSLCDVCSGAG